MTKTKRKVKWLLVVVLLVCFAGGAAKAYFNAIPDGLREQMERYPETAEFVLWYPIKKNMDFSMDISQELKEGAIPLFLQWDERWGYRSYGGNFLALNACGPACLSMVVCGLTGSAEYNPYEIAKYSEQMGYYVPGVGTSWELMTSGAENLGLNVETGDATYEYIIRSLTDGRVIICSMWPGDFTDSGHFIVLTGIDKEGNISVNDPNSKINSEKSWSLEVLLPQIRALWSYSCAEP